ncbi:MAG TPA: AMP-binding protein [Treponemataceae bacterium]|nr:AMP-binding protein [Treponemataceae bacterium]
MYKTIPLMLAKITAQHPDVAMQCYRVSKNEYAKISFAEGEQIALDFSAGLLKIGVCRNDFVGLISDNRPEWLHASIGIMSIGAMDVPRGSDVTEKELSYIVSFTECKTLVLENDAQVQKILHILSSIPLLKQIIVFESLSSELLKKCKNNNIKVIHYDDLLLAGKKHRDKNQNLVEIERAKGNADDVACVIFTSGTTGEPKGVMLTYSNFMTQLDELPERIPMKPGESALSVLPVWHSFERLCEYVILVQASTICYSKPVGAIMLEDFSILNPQLMPAVPRVFEALYEGILRAMRKKGGLSNVLFIFFLSIGKLYANIDRKLFRKTARIKKDVLLVNWLLLIIPWVLLWPLYKLGDALVFKKIRNRLGNDFNCGVSGGGALPPAVDEFFWAVGVNVVEGYGLTETAPVVAVRSSIKPVFGTIGTPIRGVEAKIVDEKDNELVAGELGIVKVRGGIVMKGYYKKPKLTDDVIDKDGWFNTGDLGLKTIDGELLLRGRVKDTIVLRGGENIEPLPIEMKLNESRYILQSIVLGQDERYLSALIVPDTSEIIEFAKENNIIHVSYEALLECEQVKTLLSNEIASLVSAKNGFKIFERINRFDCLSKEFEVGVELSAKQEIKRFAINEIYTDKIQKLFA